MEFALVLLPLLFIVFATIQYAWYFYAMQSGASATSDAVRRLSVGDCQDPTALTALLTRTVGGAAAGTVQATVTYTNSIAGHPTMTAPGVVGGGVTVHVTFQTSDFHFPMLPVPDGGLVTRTGFARVEDTNSSVGGCE